MREKCGTHIHEQNSKASFNKKDALKLTNQLYSSIKRRIMLDLQLFVDLKFFL